MLYNAELQLWRKAQHIKAYLLKVYVALRRYLNITSVAAVLFPDSLVSSVLSSALSLPSVCRSGVVSKTNVNKLSMNMCQHGENKFWQFFSN